VSTIPTENPGVSPPFPISGEEFILRHIQAITRVQIDGVEPPTLGFQAGYSPAVVLTNRWFPWIDEKLVEPKYDGVSQYLGIPSNQPTPIRDYHMLSLFRAVDAILAPAYTGLMMAQVDSIMPESPPLSPAP
jgi:hypothetical protein